MTTLPSLSLAIPLLAAAILAGGASVLPRRVLDVLAIATTAVVALICGVLTVATVESPLIVWFGNWPPRGGVAIGVDFAIDPIGGGLASLASILVLSSLVFSWRYFDAVGGLFHALMLVFLGAMVGFCLSGDLFNLFVFFELMSVAAYALTGYKVEETKSLEGALNFAVVNSLGAFLILIGIALLYGRTGSLNLAQIGRALATRPADGLVVTSFVLVSSGFLIKAAVVPFHFWLADAHAVAPTPVCVLFSGVMVELGLYAFARVYWTAFEGPLAPYTPSLRGVLLGAGTLTALLGAVMCLMQRHLKRLLAFSTVSHAGLILIGLALLSPRGLAGAAIYTLGHGMVKGALFLAAGVVLHRLGSVDSIDLRGRGRQMPFTGSIFLLGGLGLAGLPLFGTFLGKALIEVEAERLGHGWVVPVAIAASALTGGAVLRSSGRIFFGWGASGLEDRAGPHGDEEKETHSGKRRTPWGMIVPAAILIVAAIVTGTLLRLGDRVELAAARFEDRTRYAALVLDVRPPDPVAFLGPTASLPGLGTREIGLGLLTAALGVATAALALLQHRFPERVRQGFGRMTRPAGLRLRRLHSGLVGDYVTWLVVGVVAFGGLLSLTVLF